MGALAAPELSQRAKEHFVDCSRVVVFNEKLQTLYATYEVRCHSWAAAMKYWCML